jgi:uncharacterized protein YraI
MITRSITAAGLGLAAALTGGLLAATPAHAADGSEGTVTATSLTVRYGPTTASKSLGSIKKGEVIPLVCRLRGSSVDGNDSWYALPPTLNEWVSARYVDTGGTTPGLCGTDARYKGRTTATLTKRTGPTTAASSAGHLAKGASVSIICKLPGQKVAGNNRWYYLTDGRWVAARYVANVGAAPGWCNS